MLERTMQRLLLESRLEATRLPDDCTRIPYGDMPGDQILISQVHIQKAAVLLPPLAERLNFLLCRAPRAVLSVYGGSGVGKSETASLLAWHMAELGLGCYIVSGDNYPRRIPMYNDAERLQIYRTAGVQTLVEKETYSHEISEILCRLFKEERDADPTLCECWPWLSIYQTGGRAALGRYLGSGAEQDYADINRCIREFKAGNEIVFFKRMGRTPTQLWYEEVDLRNTDVLILEWTHGNNPALHGVDLPVYLSSTPGETLAHRKARARDGKIGSPFTTTVLELEQRLLISQVNEAALIVSQQGELETKSGFMEKYRQEQTL